MMIVMFMVMILRPIKFGLVMLPIVSVCICPPLYRQQLRPIVDNPPPYQPIFTAFNEDIPLVADKIAKIFEMGFHREPTQSFTSSLSQYAANCSDVGSFPPYRLRIASTVVQGII
jgi:hypothetical protein